jgi:hypothetical protein
MTAKNILRILLFILMSVLTISFSSLGWSEKMTAKTSSDKTPSIEDIVNRANRVAYYQENDGQAKVTMSIIDSQGRKRYRRFTILRRNDDTEDKRFGNQKFYVYFHRPADVNKMVFLVWKNIDKDDDRWLYLPALDLVKRIAASDKRTSFVGSHFFYEDVSGRIINEDKHELVKTTENYYVLKNTPIKPEMVEFSYYYMWIHRQTFLPIKAEYYDKNGEKYRVYEALKVEDIQGLKTVTKSRMKDLRSSEETIIEYMNVKYNIGLSEDIFTERYLRRAPAKYLR